MEQSIERGGIYLVQMENGVGSEQAGMRPFLVLQNDKGNEHSFTHSGVPLSTELKSLYLPTHIVAADSTCLEYASVVLVEQLTSLSRNRFVSRLGKLDKNTLNKVAVAVNVHLGLKDIRDIDKTVFIRRLTEINPAIYAFLCGKCLRVVHNVKELAVNGVHGTDDDVDFCFLCHKAKGRKYKVVNRRRLRRNEKTAKEDKR